MKQARFAFLALMIATLACNPLAKSGSQPTPGGVVILPTSTSTPPTPPAQISPTATAQAPPTTAGQVEPL
ncbi:MAG: hypothetical protein ACE5H9_16150, partial [Anaerolineae bacterium]